MLFQRRKKVDLVFTIFGLIALGIVFSASFLLVQLFSKKQPEDNVRSMSDETAVQPIESIPVVTSPEELRSAYQESVRSMVADIAFEDAPLENLLTQAEEKLLSIRVPREYQEQHLQVVLRIVQLRSSLQMSSDVDVRTSFKDIVQTLITQK